MGVTVVECDPGWTRTEHDPADGNYEKVYVLLDGEATVTIDGDDVDLEAGDALSIAPEATRQIQNGDTESRFVLAGTP